MHYRNYSDYLQHPLFKIARKLAFEKTGFRCELCQQPAEDAHHRNGQYPACGAFDTPDNLQPLCRKCHAKVEGKAA